MVRVFEPASPVLSLGRRSMRSDIDAHSAALAASRSLQVRTDDRGGRATLHLPGQIVALIALPLGRTDVGRLAVALLAAAGEFALNCGQPTTIGEGAALGLWVDDRKLASIGLRHEHGIVRHGIALNVAVASELATGLSLCGSETSALATIGPPQPAPLAGSLLAAFASNIAATVRIFMPLEPV